MKKYSSYPKIKKFMSIIIWTLIFIVLIGGAYAIQSTIVTPEETQYMELKIKEPIQTAENGKQIILEWYINDLEVKGSDFRIEYDKSKVVLSNIEDNKELSQEELKEGIIPQYMKFENNFEKSMIAFDQSSKEGEFRIVTVILPGGIESNEYVQTDENGNLKIDVKGKRTLFAKISFKLISGTIDEETFKIKTDENSSPKTGVKVSVNENKYYQDQKVLRITVEDIPTIEIIPPTKTEYFHGNDLSLDEGKIVYTYNDVSKNKEVPITMNMITETLTGETVNMSPEESEYGTNNKLTKNLTITYEDKDIGIKQTAKYDIEIINDLREIQMHKKPTKLRYKTGEKLDLTGAKILALRATDEEKDADKGEVLDLKEMITEGKATITGFDSSEEVKEQEVTVSYTENGITKHTTFKVIISDEFLEMEITKEPQKLLYKYGEDLDITGGEITITTKDDRKVLKITEEMVTGFKPEIIGKQTIEVTYEGLVDTYEVEVKDYEKEIKIVPPTKTIYKYGEELSAEGGEIIKVMASGAKEKIQDVTTDMITGFNNKKVGKQTLTITYNNKKQEYEVTVQKIQESEQNEIEEPKPDLKPEKNETVETTPDVNTNPNQNTQQKPDKETNKGENINDIIAGIQENRIISQGAKNTILNDNKADVGEIIENEEVVDDNIIYNEMIDDDSEKVENTIVPDGETVKRNKIEDFILYMLLIILVLLLILYLLSYNAKICILEEKRKVIKIIRVKEKNPQVNMEQVINKYPNKDILILLSNSLTEKINGQEIVIMYGETEGKILIEKTTVKYDKDQKYFEILLTSEKIKSRISK